MKYLLMLICFLSIYLMVNAQSLPSISISGTADFLKNGDTVILDVYKYGLISQDKILHESFYAQVEDNQYHFIVKGQLHIQPIDIHFKSIRNHDLFQYYLKSGDAISIKYRNDNFSVSGKGGDDFKIQYKLHQLELKLMQKFILRDFTAQNLQIHFNHENNMADSLRLLLESSKASISVGMYNFLKSDVIAEFKCNIYHWLYDYGTELSGSISIPIRASFLKYKLTEHDPPIPFVQNLCYSDFYVNYLIQEYSADSCFAKNKTFDIANALIYFSSKYKGLLREQILTSLMINNTDFPASLSPVIQSILPDITNPDYRKIFLRIQNTRLEGQQVYNFSLKDTSGKTYHPDNFSGKVLVMDFWYTGCGNCRELAPYMKIIEESFLGKNVVFVGVSTDKNKKQWVKSVESCAYGAPGTLSVYTSGLGFEDPLIQTLQIDSFPTLIVLNKEGKMFNIKTDPRIDNGLELTRVINSCL